MELTKIAEAIESKITLLEKARAFLKKRGETKAKTIADYEKAIALAIVKLKNNAIAEWETFSTEKLPTTLIEKTAKGMCYQEKLDMEVAESDYKSLIVSINAIEAELNAYQSIFRHMQET